MSNGNSEVIKEIRDVVKRGGKIDMETRDILLFSAIIDIYDQLEQMKPVLVFYRVGLYFASAIGLSVIAFIGALITGKIELIFR